MEGTLRQFTEPMPECQDVPVCRPGNGPPLCSPNLSVCLVLKQVTDNESFLLCGLIPYSAPSLEGKGGFLSLYSVMCFALSGDSINN